MPGKTLVVTGGMDGDEYTGIAAAYALIEKYATGNFAGRLIVVPIVNLLAFEAQQDRSPLDTLFPKLAFPGNPSGTSTQQLMYWFSKKYIQEGDVWIDLHSGSLTESLFPFLWIYTSGIPELDKTVTEFYTQSGSNTVIVEPAKNYPLAYSAAAQTCAYITAEAGDRGTTHPEDVAQHVYWVDMLMQTLNMVPVIERASPEKSTVYNRLAFIQATSNGIFHPLYTSQHVQKGAVLGTYSSYDNLKIKSVYATHTGSILWRKDTMAMRKGDTLVAIAH